MTNPDTDTDPYRYARIVLLISLVGLGFGFTVLFAILGPLGREVGFSEFEISAIIAASSLTVFLSSPRWGRLSDRLGRKPVLMIGIVGYTVGTLLFAGVFHLTLVGVLAPLIGYVALLVSRVAHASIMSAMMPAASAYMADITSLQTRTKGMGAVGAATNVGNILGPALGGILAGVTLLTPLWFAAGLAAVTAAFIFFVLPSAPVAHENRTADQIKPKKLRYGDPRIRSLIIVGVLMFMGMALVQQTLPFRFQDILSLDAAATAQTFGLAMGLSAAASLASQLLLMQRFDLRPFQWMLLAMPLLILAFLVMALAETRTALYLAMAMQGAAMGVAGPAFMAGASLAVGPEEQGAVAGVAGSCGPLGFTIGPLVGGALYQVQGDAPYWFTLAVYVPLLVYVFYLNRQHGAAETR